jgi:hypothetical protein
MSNQNQNQDAHQDEKKENRFDSNKSNKDFSNDKSDVRITINVEAVHAAVQNSNDLTNVAFEVPVVNPRELHYGSKIWGFRIVPIDDQIKKLQNSDARCVAIKSILVNSIAGDLKEGYLTINGTIDIPMAPGRMVKLEEVFLAKEEEALAIAKVVTEVELDKALEVVKKKQEIADFLKEQLANETW